MVSVGTQNLSASDQRTIRSIKEVVRNYSDSEIYVALKEANNNADETVQKLLNQEPFHEVRRKRFKKIENAGHNGSAETEKRIEHTGPVVKSHPPDHSVGNARAAGYSRTDSGNGREFRIVRDNRVNQNVERRKNPATIPGGSTVDARASADVSEKSAMENNQKPYSVRNSGRPFTRMNYSRLGVSGDNKTNADRKEFFQERKSGFSNSASNTKNTRQNTSQNPTSDAPMSDLVVGVTSASDPVHVPSISSRAPATSAKWREVGATGFRRQSSGNGVKQSSRPGSSNSNVIIGSTSAMESSRAINHVLKKDHAGHETVSDSLRFSPSGGRGFLSNNHGRQYQPVGHQKGAPSNKEWKPKSKDKPNETNPGVIGTPIKSVVPSVDNSRNLELEAAELHDQLSQVNISEDQNVIIAHHIRVPENDRCRLTFGSFGSDSDTYGNSVSEPQVVRHTGESMELSGRDDVSAGNQATALEEQVGGSGSTTPSEEPSDHVLPDINESSTAPTLENYDDLGLVHENSQVYENSQDMSAPEPPQLQDPPELPSFSQAYDLQTGCDIPYFRHSIDEAVRGHGLPQEQGLTSHTANIPAASMTMMQQQPPMTQMYPQVHVPHFPNVMPYRQFISPMYVPPMGVPGYSSNPAYPHPSNGSSYVMMPGGSSQLNTNGLKYGMQQFKPVPAGSPTFGNYATPSGYSMNNPRMVGGVTGIEDSSRIKYKDSNMYLQNPQAETSEVWIQTPRELSGMQSAPYYNMQGQAAHPAYLQSHTGHAPYNAAAVAHTSHMQFPGMYHPQQPAAAMTNPTHLGVGLPSAAPAAQPGAFQQPQLGHLNWATNF
ncbi:hypothetical protein AKJ16_DCAP08772 [Drosera capensis]